MKYSVYSTLEIKVKTVFQLLDFEPSRNSKNNVSLINTEETKYHHISSEIIL